MPRRLAMPSFAIVALVALLGLLPAAARAEATVESSTVEVAWPRQLIFKLTASAPAEITDVTLNYELVGRGTSGLAKPTSLTPARRLSVDVPIEVNSGNGFVPVGSEFVYRWQITTADGVVTTSAEQRYLHMPPGRQWQSVENDFMRIYFYGDRAALAQAYLKAGQETYDRIGKQLLKTELKQLPVKVTLFGSEAEMSEAQQSRGQVFDANTVICGTKYAADILYLMPQACGSADRTDTLRHEFGHILNQLAGEGTLSKLPAWLDEGTAVYAQTSPGDYETAYRAALRQGRLLPFNRMASSPDDPAQVGVFYGQAWAMVSYLVDRGGPEKYAAFFATIKSGTRFDQALQQTYNLDLAGFEAEFLAAARGASQATATPAGPSP